MTEKQNEKAAPERYEMPKRLDALEKRVDSLEQRIEEAFTGIAKEVRPVFGLGGHLAVLFDAAAKMFRRG